MTTEEMNRLVDVLDKRLEMRLKAEIEPIKKAVEAVDKKVEALDKKLDERTDHLVELIIHTADGIFDKQEPRFRRIEEHLGFSQKN